MSGRWAIFECEQSIRRLIQRERLQNTQHYSDLINGEGEIYANNNLSELDYFKKKMSYQDQMRIMEKMMNVNKYIICDKPYRIRLLESNMDDGFQATVMHKLNMLESIEPGDPEYYKIKNWVDTFMRIPFGQYVDLSVNFSSGIRVSSAFMYRARAQLDTCVFGLHDCKMQIMQMIGQFIVNPSAVGTAFAIKGPMGTGKTSIGFGISKILERKFAFIALGGQQRLYASPRELY